MMNAMLLLSLCNPATAGDWGGCLVNILFGGDFTFAGILLLVGVGIILVKFGLPFETIYPVAISLTFLLWVISGSTIMLGLFALTLVIAGALMGFSLMGYFKG